jgi:hypothetical protein
MARSRLDARRQADAGDPLPENERDTSSQCRVDSMTTSAASGTANRKAWVEFLPVIGLAVNRGGRKRVVNWSRG